MSKKKIILIIKVFLIISIIFTIFNLYIHFAVSKANLLPAHLSVICDLVLYDIFLYNTKNIYSKSSIKTVVVCTLIILAVILSTVFLTPRYTYDQAVDVVVKGESDNYNNIRVMHGNPKLDNTYSLSRIVIPKMYKIVLNADNELKIFHVNPVSGVYRIIPTS